MCASGLFVKKVSIITLLHRRDTREVVKYDLRHQKACISSSFIFV
jgi:hypothetical protein